MRIDVVGLGHLGLPLAALYAKAGHSVVGIDTNAQLVESLTEGYFSSVELGLNELLYSLIPEELSFSTSYTSVSESAVTFVVVPTPSNPDGTYSLDVVLNVCDRIGTALLYTKKHHTVVIVSTVNPGDTENIILPTLREVSQRVASLDVAYSPEFVALGDVLQGLQRPDFVMLGIPHLPEASTLRDFLFTLATSMVESGTPVLSALPVEAELAKIALNSYITMKISFANMIGQISESLEGCNGSTVLSLIGEDHRIGHEYLRMGGPYAGPCFPRDNQALAKVGGAWSHLPVATDILNDLLRERIALRIEQIQKEVGLSRVLIVGLTYKPDTDVTAGSLGTWLMDRLEMPHAGVDALLTPDEYEFQLGGSLQSTLVVLATPDHEYNQLLILNALNKVGAFLDVWDVLDVQRANVYHLGVG